MITSGSELVPLLQRLRLLGAFPSLPDSVVEAIAREGRTRTYPAGTTLFIEGDSASAIFIVLEGHVAVVRVVSGREHPLHHERAGGTLGEVPVFSNCGYLATAVARVETHCLVISADSARRLVRQQPEFAAWVIDRLGARIVALVNRVEAATSLSTTERVARYISDRANRSPGERFRLGMSQQQVATELGTVREVVSRILKSFVDDGVLSREPGGWFIVSDAAKLRALQGRVG